MNTQAYVTPDMAVKLLKKSGGKFFSIRYYSKKEGDVINRTGRLGVKKHLKGIGKGYKDSDKGLITYFDTMKNSYRSPRIENIRSFTIGKIDYNVSQSNRILTTPAVAGSLDVDLSVL